MKLLSADELCEVFDLVGELGALAPMGLIVFLYLILGVNEELYVLISLINF